MSKSAEKVSLEKITSEFLVNFLKDSRAKFKLIKNAKRISQDGETHELEYLVVDEYTNEEIGVRCKDWDRSISITVVNSFIDDIKRIGLSSGILVGERFSESARMRAEEVGIMNLLTRGRMVTWMVQHGIQYKP